MSHTIEWERNSWNELNSLPKDVSLRIYEKVDSIKENPAHFLEKLQGMPEWKLRVGEYRVIILLLQNEQKLKIQAVGHRRNIYKKYKTN